MEKKERVCDRDVLIAMFNRAEIEFDFVENDGSIEVCDQDEEWQDESEIAAFVFDEHGDLKEFRVEPT